MTNKETATPHRTISALNAGAELISWLFSPLLMPTYGTWIALWGSPLAWLPTRIRWHAVIYTLVITCFIPLVLIGALRLFRVIRHIALRDRADRTIPYIAALLCYAVCALHFYTAHAPQWFYMFFVGAGVSIMIVGIINLRWKISAHATAAGGLTAIVVRLALTSVHIHDLTGPLTAVIIMAGLSGTARLLLGRHTPAQIWAGYLNGFVCVFTAATL